MKVCISFSMGSEDGKQVVWECYQTYSVCNKYLEVLNSAHLEILHLQIYLNCKITIYIFI